MYLWLPFGSFGSFGSFATFALAALALAFRLVLRAAALGSMIGGDATLASSYLLISSSQVVQFSSGSLQREERQAEPGGDGRQSAQRRCSETCGVRTRWPRSPGSRAT